MADINARPLNEGNAGGADAPQVVVFLGIMGVMGRMGKVGMAGINARTPNEGEEKKKWRYFKSIIP